MGQDNSSLVDDDIPPETLSERTLAAVARYIKDGKAQSIVAMTGAGISTAAGIPDFRSPGTGLYNNLARLNLPHPEAVFEIEFFRENPAPFYVLARELYPGNFSPTLAHAFIALLAQRGLLRMLFTQNIDCLERAAGVPGDIIVEAHGSFASQRCIDCKAPFPDKEMREHVELGDPPSCAEPGCDGLVKPDIVFFGEQLPSSFFDNRHVPAEADLVLVLGTSLSVQPFASLPGMAREGVPRVLFNMQRVGDLGTRPDDVLCLDTCDAGVRKLAEHLGWIDDLEAMWVAVVGDKEAERQRNVKSTWAPAPDSDTDRDSDDDGSMAAGGEGPIINDRTIAELVAGMEDKLGLTDNHHAVITAEADDNGRAAEQDHNQTKEEQQEGQAQTAAQRCSSPPPTPPTEKQADQTREGQSMASGTRGSTQAVVPAAATAHITAGGAHDDTDADTHSAPQRHATAQSAEGVHEGNGDDRHGSQEKTESPAEATKADHTIERGAVATYTPITPEDGRGKAEGGAGENKPAL